MMAISRILLRVLVALSLMGWGQFVLAVDYSWTISVSGYTGKGPSPKAALEQFCAVHPSYGPGGYCEPSRHTLIRFDDATWQVRFFFTDGREAGRHNIIRSGDSCPSGTSYNSLTGECEGDKCEVTVGNFIYHEFAFATIGENSNPSTDPPITVCKDSCQYSHTYDGYTVKSRRDFTPPDKIIGYFKYKGNGISCTPSSNDPSVFDQPPSKEPVTTPPELTHESNCNDWVSNPDGTLTRSCTSKKEFKEPGSIECTDGYSIDSCKPVSPSPEYTKTDVSETTTEKTNPDGSKSSDTTKTTDKTSCKGLNPCSSTSKTETTTSETGADGKPGNTSSNCTGDACADDKDGDGEEDKEEPEERTASVGSCDAAFSCTGDAIDCAILKKQKEQQCFAEDQADFEGNKADIEGLFEGQGDKFTLDEGSGDIDVPSFINQGTRFLPSSCPEAENFSLTTAGGRSFTLSYEPLCRAASDLSGLFVAVATILAALYVGRSVGGN